MNTTQLECFVAVANTLNFARSAEQLSMSQPAVSKQIQSLETELGARLLDRTTRSVCLTQVGVRFLPEATDILHAIYHSRDWISTFQNQAEYSLRIGYSDPNDIPRISMTLAKVRKKHPNLSPQFTIDQTDANLARLQHGLLDIVVAIRNHSFSDETIAFEKIRDDHFCCILSADHPLADHILNSDNPDEVTSQQLWDTPQVVSIPPYLVRTLFSRGHRILPFNESLPNVVCTNVNEAYGCVLAGFGYSMVPEHLLMPHPDLVFLRWKESRHTPFGIYYQKQARGSDSVILRDYLKAAPEFYTDKAIFS